MISNKLSYVKSMDFMKSNRKVVLNNHYVIEEVWGIEGTFKTIRTLKMNLYMLRTPFMF